MKHLLALKARGYDLFVELPDTYSKNQQEAALKQLNHLLSGIANKNSVTVGRGHDEYSTCRCGEGPCDCGMFKCHSHYS